MTAQIIDFASRRSTKTATTECHTHWTIEDERAFSMLRKEYGDRTAAQIVESQAASIRAATVGASYSDGRTMRCGSCNGCSPLTYDDHASPASTPGCSGWRGSLSKCWRLK